MDVSYIFQNLNNAQREAVSSESQSLLVLAGAGSGKTRVIAHRVAWIVKALNISPQSLLTVTFTNKAAREMRGRIEEILEDQLGDFWCGTFHGISHRILRRHWEEAGLRKEFAILDSEDQLRVVKRVCKSLQIDDSKWPAKQIQWYINKEKDEGRRPEDAETGDYFSEQMTNIYSEYQALCNQESLVDFGELLLRTYELIDGNEKILNHYRARFKHILVDEFQDTNEVQYKFLLLLKGNENNISAVGDDDQSIYGWRGAKSDNINRFTKDLKNTQVVRLEQNYRSTQVILDAANAVIQNNSGRMGKDLWTEEKEGEKISVYSAYNEDDEARYVVGTIQDWVAQGNNLDEVAILYRSNAQSRALEEAILRESLPYRIYGGQRFYERAEIKNAMAYIRLVFGKEDDAAFERVINIPPRGIGAKTLDIIRNKAKGTKQSLWMASQELIDLEELTPRAMQSVQGFISDMDSLSLEVKEMDLKGLVDFIIERSGLIDYHKKEAGEKGRTRVENLSELVSAADDFMVPAQEEEISELKSFIDHAALDAGDAQAEEHESAIQLMTLHSAKGLEFPLVFITGFEEGLFPHKLSVEEPDQLQEERRLCYVGMTRAEKKLYLTYSNTRTMWGGTNYYLPSRFIDEAKPYLKEIKIHQESTDNKSNSVGSLGKKVIHEKYGSGIVEEVNGNEITVNFGGEHGIKHLDIEWAPIIFE